MESQNGWGWKRPLEVFWSNHPVKHGHPELVAWAVSRYLLNNPKDRDSPASLDSLCQCSVTVKKSIFLCSGETSFVSACAHCFLSCPWETPGSVFCTPFLQCINIHWSHEPSLQAEQSQLPQPFLIAEMLIIIFTVLCWILPGSSRSIFYWGSLKDTFTKRVFSQKTFFQSESSRFLQIQTSKEWRFTWDG